MESSYFEEKNIVSFMVGACEDENFWLWWTVEWVVWFLALFLSILRQTFVYMQFNINNSYSTWPPIIEITLRSSSFLICIKKRNLWEKWKALRPHVWLFCYFFYHVSMPKHIHIFFFMLGEKSNMIELLEFEGETCKRNEILGVLIQWLMSMCSTW